MRAGRATRLVAAMLMVLLVPALAAGARKKKGASQAGASSATESMIQQAKAFMAQGSRKQALELLDRAAAQTRSKSDSRDVAAKRQLFAEQFLTADSFQNYQEARSFAALERWDECLRELESMGEKDKDNVLVLRQRAQCQFAAKQFGQAETTLKAVLALVPGDSEANFDLADLSLATKQASQGLTLLETIEPKTSNEIERYAVVKAKLLELSERAEEAADLLRDDQEKHLDHVGVLYELGMLYTRLPGHDWQARKMLSLFVTRCKRLREADLKSRKFDVLVPQAQSTLATLDKKLGV